MRRKYLFPALLLLAALTGCGGKTQAVVHTDRLPEIAAPIPQSCTEAKTRALPSNPVETEEILSFSYDLGEETVGKMPFHIRGRLALPAQGDRLPVVLILHGSHGGKDPDAGFYEGFSYLADALAHRGYAAVSLDIQPAYVTAYGQGDDDRKAAVIAARNLDCLRRANDGEALFPADLTQRLDLNSLVLVGHSRGGDTALDLACAWEGVVGACAIAPGLREAEKNWGDFPLVVLVPELDGDVTELDGYSYLYPRYRANISAPTAVTLLKGANHNFFNSRLTEDDALRSGADLGHRLTAEQQQDFLCDYLADFCDDATRGLSAQGLFAPSLPVPAEMYGLSVRNLLLTPGGTPLADAEQGAPASPGCVTRRITVDRRTRNLLVPLTLGTDHALTFWELRWDGPVGAADLPLRSQDLSGYDRLDLNLAPAAGLGAADELTLTLTDASGRCEAVLLEAPAPGAVGVRYTVFSTVSASLADFPGLDLSQITRLTLFAQGGGLWVAGVFGA